MAEFKIINADCLDAMRAMQADSIDAIVTDPPYGLGFMGKQWDALPPGREWAEECLRVLKPGGHLLAFGGTRTWHRLAVAIEDAGFEIRDSIAWMYGSGFPKSMDVSKAIDKAAGATREVVGHRKKLDSYGEQAGNSVYGGGPNHDGLQAITAPATPEAEQWQGWGTALKPAFEPIVVARKPLQGTVAANVLEHGTGALNIDGCRIGTRDKLGRPQGTMPQPKEWGTRSSVGTFVTEGSELGRWPANVVLDEDQAAALDEQSGVTKSSVRKPSGRDDRGVPNTDAGMVMRRNDTEPRGVADSGGASRFFYIAKDDPTCVTHPGNAPTKTGTGAPGAASAESTKESAAPSAGVSGDTTSRFLYTAKASKKERPVVNGIAHPTVKPLALMRWLVRLVTPPSGTVLDPFAGSGTTVEAALLEGFDVIGIEREADYLPLIEERIKRVRRARKVTAR